MEISEYLRYLKNVKHTSHLYYICYNNRLVYYFYINDTQGTISNIAGRSITFYSSWFISYKELKMRRLTFFIKSFSGRHKLEATFISFNIVNVLIMQDFPNNVNFLRFHESNNFFSYRYIISSSFCYNIPLCHALYIYIHQDTSQYFQLLNSIFFCICLLKSTKQ